MILTTTPTVEGRTIDALQGHRHRRGRSRREPRARSLRKRARHRRRPLGSYEKELQRAREIALDEMREQLASRDRALTRTMKASGVGLRA
jgi:uncharacterized protein YbjQ (UPF0145 family)